MEIIKPLRILLAGYRSHPFVGGQGIYLNLLSKSLIQLGHHVDVISGPPYPSLDSRVKLIKLPSLDMYDCKNPFTCLNTEILMNKTNLFEWFSYNSGGFPEPYTFGKRLEQYIRNKIDQYDILHDNQTLSYGILNIQNMGLPTLATIHHPITKDRHIDMTHAPDKLIKFLKWRWYSFMKMQIKVARQLDMIISVSDRALRDICHDFELSQNCTHYIHLGINHDVFHPLPHITRKTNQLITMASANVPLKGLIFLMRAFAQLRKQHPDLELRVISKLREGATLRELHKLKLQNHVRFQSDLSVKEICHLYAESTIAIVPSLYEGFGLPAGEALSCGIPLIATDGGALPEIVSDAGIIVPHSDSDTLAKTIHELLINPDKQKKMSGESRQYILNNFTWEHYAHKIVDIYHNTIKKHTSCKQSS